MDRVFIDEETGEDLIHPLVDCDIRHRPNNSTTVNNAETGEPEVSLVEHSTVRGHLRRVPFQVTPSIAKHLTFCFRTRKYTLSDYVTLSCEMRKSEKFLFV